MPSIEQAVKEIAVPLTGFIIDDKEAKDAYDKLIALSDSDFVAACNALSHHGFRNDSKRNKIKDLLDNLPSSKVDRILQRMLDVTTPAVLRTIPKDETTPFAVFVISMHTRLRGMGLGKRGALRLLNKAIADGKFNRSIRTDYQARFGVTDDARGWDKAMHFSKAAWIAYTNVSDAVIASYGKEAYDQAEFWIGKDPEGWSNADIDADMLGIGWAMTLKSGP
jgi:hypothetical protein